MTNGPEMAEGSTITTTHNGTNIDLRNPIVDLVDIEDIAHNLSHICRWNGIPHRFFSVAEHCIMASEMAPPEHKLALLMHDCEEGILGDNITPLKNLIPELRVIGDKIRNLLLERFNVPYDEEMVKKYDRLQLEWERENIVRNEFRDAMDSETARNVFLYKYKQYVSLLKND